MLAKIGKNQQSDADLRWSGKDCLSNGFISFEPCYYIYYQLVL